ncbi:MAG TPA: hypothetical protein VN769_10800 [Xanthobacteraceae bacterium]|nr:hypothetical protein [Xanthobacteraceae bacterium]
MNAMPQEDAADVELSLPETPTEMDLPETNPSVNRSARFMQCPVKANATERETQPMQ